MGAPHPPSRLRAFVVNLPSPLGMGSFARFSTDARRGGPMWPPAARITMHRKGAHVGARPYPPPSCLRAFVVNLPSPLGMGSIVDFFAMVGAAKRDGWSISAGHGVHRSFPCRP